MRKVLLASAACLAMAEQRWMFNGKESVGNLSAASQPTICDTVEQWAGYYNIDAKTNKNYFYWAFASRGNPKTDPTVLWMTGGPGCSGDLALFAENGPCKVADNMTTIPNPYSWNSNANLVYIDQPVGTGFSYGDKSGYDSTEAEVAEDMYHFLQALFGDHKEWLNNDFIITGESYGGHYVPATAHRVWKGNKEGKDPVLPLKGIAVGNGLTDPEIQYAYYGQHAYNYSIARLGHPSISLEAYTRMQAAIPDCIAAITKCQNDTSVCTAAQSQCNGAMLGPYEATGLNPYDFRIKCVVPGLCYDFSAVTKYLNLPAVQKELGVNKVWASCNYEVNAKFSADWMKNYQTQLLDLLANDVRVLIYAGECDFICNWIGNKAWTKALNWPGKSAFNAAADGPWLVDNKEAGVIRSVTSPGHFTFLQVHSAGHMVPMDQPVAALQMLTEFIAGKI